jgi:hypothetical protein
MPSLELSQKESAKLESYRKFKKVSRRKAISEAIIMLKQQQEFEETVAELQHANAEIDPNEIVGDIQKVVEEDRAKRRKH